MVEYNGIYNELLYKREALNIYNNSFERGWYICNKTQYMELLFEEI